MPVNCSIEMDFTTGRSKIDQNTSQMHRIVGERIFKKLQLHFLSLMSHFYYKYNHEVNLRVLIADQGVTKKQTLKGYAPISVYNIKKTFKILGQQ